MNTSCCICRLNAVSDHTTSSAGDLCSMERRLIYPLRGKCTEYTGVYPLLCPPRRFTRRGHRSRPSRSRRARENLGRLGLADRVEVLHADLFPEGRAQPVVCNPPWIPARPSSPIEQAIYDPDSRMLRGFLNGLAAHLEPGGEGWLLLSDLAEYLGLRSRAELLAAFEKGGLIVIGKSDVRPNHRRTSDQTDPLRAARAAEVMSLWRLVVNVGACWPS